MVTHFWGRCQSQIGSPLGSLAAALLGLSLLFQSPAVSADSTPYPARLNSQAYYGTLYVSPMFPTTLQACEWLVGNWPNTSSPFFTNDYPPGQGYAGGICYASQNGGGPIGFGLWKRYTDCPKGGQVDDATVATPMCSCPAGWMFPPGGPVPGGPVCVLDTCPVTVTQGTWVSLDAEETKIYFSAVPRDDGSIYLPVFAGGHLEGVVRCTTDCPKSERDIKLPPLAAPDFQVGNDTVSLETYLDGWKDNFKGYYGENWPQHEEIKALIKQWRATDPTYFCR